MDICLALMRRPAKLAHRFIQYQGLLAVSSVTLGELYAGAHKHSQWTRILGLITDLRIQIQVLDFDAVCAETFGQIRGTLLQQGISVSTTDLMIASAALVHDLTMVTYNTKDYQNIPGSPREIYPDREIHQP
ncbi:MAG: type II toxin-antitoxin system VapC family toxin [Gemmataceae bacterium]